MVQLRVDTETDGEGNLRLRTRGMRRRGRPELEWAHLTLDDVEEASRLAMRVAEAILQLPKLPSYTLTIDANRVVRVEEALEEPVGDFGRWMGAVDQTVLRIRSDR